MNDLRLNQNLLDHIGSNLNQFGVCQLDNRKLQRAAVALTIVNAAEDPRIDGLSWSPAIICDAAIMLTRRSEKLKKHAGQWALPGGRMDSGETPEQSALREFDEEVGIVLPSSTVIGRLDDYPTRSGFCITPIIVWGGSNLQCNPNPGEVESIHHIPLKEFMRDDAPMLEHIPEYEHPVLRMPLGDGWVAAPTAALIYQFIEVAIRGRQTRVAHFEQPYFAWK